MENAYLIMVGEGRKQAIKLHIQPDFKVMKKTCKGKILGRRIPPINSLW